MTVTIGRRELLAALGCAVAWPLAAHALQGERVRRIGVLMLYPENDSEGQLRAKAFRQGLEKLGWVDGRNVQIDFQWGSGDADWIRSAAAQFLRLQPDLILSNGTPAAKTMQQSSRTVPVIFIAGSDPVLDGLVLSLANPGANLTGSYVFEPSLGAKLLELLKEIAPHVGRVAILSNPDADPASWIASAVAAAPRFAVEVVSAPLRHSNEIEAAVAEWGRERNFGLIVVPDPAVLHPLSRDSQLSGTSFVLSPHSRQVPPHQGLQARWGRTSRLTPEPRRRRRPPQLVCVAHDDEPGQSD